jgi:hypothetical protein
MEYPTIYHYNVRETWNIMEYHGLSWIIMDYHTGISKMVGFFIGLTTYHWTYHGSSQR